MDVRCRQCGTEYELDDTRVGTAGITVKCSSCGHVFKVMASGLTHEASGAVRAVPNPDTPVLGTPPSNPPQPAAAAPSAAAGDWMVKKTDGQVFRFRELTTLQKWIVERKVVREDEISRTGRSWKKLGEIAELTSFFQVVEAADAAQRTVTASQLPQVHLTATPTGTFSAYPLQQAIAAGMVPAPTAGQPFNPLAQPLPPPSLPTPMAPVQTLTERSTPGTQRPPPPAPHPQPEPAGVADDVDLDDDDPVLAWQRQRRRLTMAAGFVVTAVVVAAIVFVVLKNRPSGLPIALRNQVQVALARGDDQSRADAIAALTASPDAAAPAVRARLMAEEVRALREALRLAAESQALATELKVDPPAVSPALAAAPARAEQLLADAGAIVMSSRAGAEAGPDADLAAAVLAVARGDTAAIAAETNQAREHARALDDASRAAIDDELRLILSIAEATATAPADAVAARSVAGKLARFSDARARAAGAIAGLAIVRKARATAWSKTPPESIDPAIVADSRAALATLPASDPRRAAGDALLTLLATPPPAPEVEPEVIEETPETPTTPTTPATPTGADDSFDALMRRGEKALLSERSAAAYDAFKKATVKDTTSARAWLKLGWAALDSGKKTEAPKAFARALSLSPGLSEAQFGLAEALRFNGRVPEAVAAYKRYLELDPKGKDANIAKNAIEQLE